MIRKEEERVGEREREIEQMLRDYEQKVEECKR